MASRRNRRTVGVQRPRVSLTQAAVEQIKDMIVRGELRPGDKLPVESELAARLGLSRGSLREAVRALACTSSRRARATEPT